jgi:hypothetical protein
MDARALLDPLLETLSEDRLRQLIEFARFLAREDEQHDWQRFGQAQLARAYGPDEPDYTETGVRGDLGSPEGASCQSRGHRPRNQEN